MIKNAELSVIGVIKMITADDLDVFINELLEESEK